MVVIWPLADPIRERTKLGRKKMNMKQSGFAGVSICLVAMLTGLVWAPAASALTPVPVGTGVQCPNDVDNTPFGTEVGPEDFDWNGDGEFNQADGTPLDPNVVCRRIGATDGYAKMADGTNQYLFGFMDLTGVPENEIVDRKFHAELPAPPINVKEGQELYITLTNLALLVRPDLADPHTIHFHGYPHAMAIFDGVPETSLSMPSGSSFTYYYKLNDAGTYPYHCHVEPVEHLELGMVGTIVVAPKQDGDDGSGTDLLTSNYAYNDGGLAPDTRYDKSFLVHLHDIWPRGHFNLETVQEGTTEWVTYHPQYATLNGRTYPETLLPDNDPAMTNAAGAYFQDYIAQKQSGLIEATAGERVLLRVDNLSYRNHTLSIPGIPMHVVGEDARILRGPTGQDMSYSKVAYNISAGKTTDIILDTTGLAPGTYFLYGRELFTQAGLSMEDYEATEAGDGTQFFGAENRGGLITEIWIH